MNYRFIIFISFTLFLLSCETNHNTNPSPIEQESTCINCACVAEVFDNLNEMQNREHKNCSIEHSTLLNIFSWLWEDEGVDENCRFSGENFSTHLSSSFNQNACGTPNMERPDLLNNLITRCNEDQKITPLASRRIRARVSCSDAKFSDCKDIQAYTNSAILLTRAENEHFLADNLSLIFSNSNLENDDEVLRAIKLITLHADYNTSLRELVLSKFKKMAKEQKIDPNIYIELFDRKAFLANTEQIYGWTTKCVEGRAIFAPSLKNEDTANQKRAAIGAPSVNLFLEEMSTKRCRKN